MKIDNFDLIRSHLTFESDLDRYIVIILKRVKDENGRKYGVNETNRRIKTYFISSIDYFDKKIPVIKDLCESNNARAYILPQVRNNKECLINLMKITLENLENPTIKPDTLITSAFSGTHTSRDKKWIIDLDDSNMTEYPDVINPKLIKTWAFEQVEDVIKKMLKGCGKTNNDYYVVPTVHGKHIVTSPFDLIKAQKICPMLYQGVQNKMTKIVSTGPDEYEYKYEYITGWLIKDGMTLLYFNDEKWV